jgi:hypothetical protein
MGEPAARVIAFYLPQYHPIRENDEWWGPGFTEWMHVVRARPLFKGHVQPKLPADLGFYDLRVPEVRDKQAQLARDHGIEGFCYWHYWLGGGRRLLDRPFNDVLESGIPDFPFCLAWANHDWSGKAFGAGRRLLAKQTYPGWDDHTAHFQFLAGAFSDARYIRVDGKPLLYIFRPREVPDCRNVLAFWRERAVAAGFPGLHIVGEAAPRGAREDFGLDAVHITMHRYIDVARPVRRSRPIEWLMRLLSGFGARFEDPIQRFEYKEAIKYMLNDSYAADEYPNIVPNWDTTPRLNRGATVFTNATPELFEKHVREALAKVSEHPPQQRILFLRAWNEWAEGNYMEPDEEFGLGRLQALKRAVDDFNPSMSPPQSESA